MILVTGATGFIGRELCDALIRDGDQVGVLTRARGEDSPEALQSELGVSRVTVWDPLAGPPAPEIFDGVSAVVNLMGEPVSQRWSKEVKDRIYRSRVEGTRHLVAGMAQAGVAPTVLVSASAVGYYGDGGEEYLSEESFPGDDFLSNVCIEWEAAANEANALGTRVVCLRTGIVLDDEGGALMKMLGPFRKGVGGRLASGKQWMAWIHLDDLVGLIRWALTDPQVEGPINATSPNPVRNKEFTKTLGRLLRRPTLARAPKLALRMIFGEFARAGLLASQRVCPDAARRAGYEFTYPELEGALRQILRD